MTTVIIRDDPNPPYAQEFLVILRVGDLVQVPNTPVNFKRVEEARHNHTDYGFNYEIRLVSAV